MKGGGGKGGSQTQTVKLDPAAEKYRNALYKSAMAKTGLGGDGTGQVQTAGYDPGFRDAYSGVQGLGDAAARESGIGYGAANRFLDPAQFGAAVQGYMDPYQQQVIDATRAQMDDQRARAMMESKQMATGQNAYGGSRHGVMDAMLMRDSAKDENSLIAQLLSQGYGQAAGLAAQAGQLGANLGMGAGQQALGAYGMQGSFADQLRQLQQQRLDEPFRALEIARGVGASLPTGNTSSIPMQSSPLMGAAGGAMAGGSMFGLPGAIGGGLVGLFGGFG